MLGYFIEIFSLNNATMNIFLEWWISWLGRKFRLGRASCWLGCTRGIKGIKKAWKGEETLGTAAA